MQAAITAYFTMFIKIYMCETKITNSWAFTFFQLPNINNGANPIDTKSGKTWNMCKKKKGWFRWIWWELRIEFVNTFVKERKKTFLERKVWFCIERKYWINVKNTLNILAEKNKYILRYFIDLMV